MMINGSVYISTGVPELPGQVNYSATSRDNPMSHKNPEELKHFNLQFCDRLYDVEAGL
jgi:hypothetical protein